MFKLLTLYLSLIYSKDNIQLLSLYWSSYYWVIYNKVLENLPISERSWYSPSDEESIGAGIIMILLLSVELDADMVIWMLIINDKCQPIFIIL